MELQVFIDKLRDLFEDTDPAEITENTHYQELDEWSSLLALSILALLKMDYGQTVTGAEIRECTSVSDLFRLVENKMMS